MSRITISLRLIAACVAIAIFAGGLNAFPNVKPAKGKNKKPGAAMGPIPTAIKDLQAAQKNLDDKKFTIASEAMHAAEDIVKNQAQIAKQPEKQGGDKAKAETLKGVIKDIKDAESKIAARKSDEAAKAIKSAIDALEGLSPPDRKKPEAKKKN
jgi:outer membrane murein-binding lipoprotein Lpp